MGTTFQVGDFVKATTRLEWPGPLVVLAGTRGRLIEARGEHHWMVRWDHLDRTMLTDELVLQFVQAGVELLHDDINGPIEAHCGRGHGVGTMREVCGTCRRELARAEVFARAWNECTEIEARARLAVAFLGGK